MATSSLVVANGDTPTTDGIFAGLGFFLVQRLPSRSSFVNKIQSNGGRVVKLEAQADHVIADHYRKDSPPGSISYTFVDAALENGALPKVEDHPAGPPKGTVRPAGAGLPTKGTRTPFTREDDRELYLWVKKHEARGGSVKGNELYKQLEARNARHTYQAWRDRYIKKLMENPPAGVDVEGEEEGEEEEEDALNGLDGQADGPAQRRGKQKKQSPRKKRKIVVGDEEFREEEFEKLLRMGNDIEDLQPDRVEEAWEAYANMEKEHSAAAWRRLWDEVGRAEYLDRKRAKEGKGASSSRAGNTKQAVPGSQGDGDAENASAHVSGPERPESSASLKRKRVTPTPRKQQATYGRKKAKASNDVFEIEDSDDDHMRNGTAQATQVSKRAEARDSVAASESAQNDKDFRNGIAQADQLPNAMAKGAVATSQPAEKDTSDPQAEVRPASEHDESALPTSEVNKAAAMQLDDDFERLLAEKTPQTSQQNETQSSQARIDDALITSEASQAAATQLDVEHEDSANKLEPEAARGDQNHSQTDEEDEQATAVFASQEQTNGLVDLTSDVNREADEQLRRESLDRVESQEDDHSSSSGEPTSPEPDGNRDEEGQPSKSPKQAERAQGGGPSAADSESSLDSERLQSQPYHDARESVPQQAFGNALTEENLATQDEQHQSPVTRAADLPQDDEMQDQSDFLKYLQDVTGAAQPGQPKPLEPRNQAPSAPPQEPSMLVEVEARHASSAPSPQPEISRSPSLKELPLSSQQELDEIFDETLTNWPHSPVAAKASQNSRPKSQEQSAQFETQVAYPALSPTHFSGKLFSQQGEGEEQQAVGYPELPKGKALGKGMSLEELQARFDREVLAPAAEFDKKDEGANSGEAGTSTSGSAKKSARPVAHDWTKEEDDLLLLGMSTKAVSTTIHQVLQENHINRTPSAARSRYRFLVRNQQQVQPQSTLNLPFAGLNGDAEVDGDINLEVPEPEGGFGFSSQQQSTAPEDYQFHSDPMQYENDQDDADEHQRDLELTSSPPPRSQTSRLARSQGQSMVQEAIEITSTSSSPSSSAPASQIGADDRDEQMSEGVPRPADTPDAQSVHNEDDHDYDEEEEETTPRAHETQNFFNAETQANELNMPLPDEPFPDYDEDDRPSSTFPSSPHYQATQRTQPSQPLESQTALSDDDVDEYITRLHHLNKYSEPSIIRALKATSMRSDLAELVLLEEKAGRGFPDDVPGIWSAEDDRALDGCDARAIRRVEEKHGGEEVYARLEWLGEWREDGQGSQEEGEE